jgi:hypothetical protein
MAFEQSAGGAELVEDLGFGQSVGFGHRLQIADHATRPKRGGESCAGAAASRRIGAS